MSYEHPILVQLRARRRELGLTKRAVQTAAQMNRSTFDRREEGRCAILEQLTRWAAVLGYKLALVKIGEEPEYWS